MILSFIEDFNSQKITINVISIFKKLTIQCGNFYSINCRARLGDKKCGINLSKFAKKGKIQNIIEKNIFIGDHEFISLDYFNFGNIEIINDFGIFNYQIINEKNNKIEIIESLNNSIQNGDIYTINPGCDKNWQTCKNKFNNLKNFCGEPYIEFN